MRRYLIGGLIAVIAALGADALAGGPFYDAASAYLSTGGGSLAGDLTICDTCAINAGTDPADAGSIRLANSKLIEWEASPAGTDYTLTVNTSEVLVASGALQLGGYLQSSDGNTFVDGSGLELGSAEVLTWSSASSGGASQDTGLARGAAGLVKVTNGSSGDGRLAAPGEVMDVGTTCTKGEIMIDTGGATVEICVCTATDTIRCVATTTTNPTN